MRQEKSVKHFAYVWELGTGYAHLSLGLPIVDEWARRGYRVSMIVADRERAAQVIGSRPIAIHQSPLWNSNVRRFDGPRTYPQILKNCGYGDPVRLRDMLQRWTTLLERIDVDGLLFDHAPTAMLAARGLGIPTAVVGHGFLVPPATSPMPPFWFDRSVAESHWVDDEALVLEC